MRFTELDEDHHADYWQDVSKNLNNSLEHWIWFAAEYWDIELTEYEARQHRAEIRATEDKRDRYHNQLRDDNPWF